MATGRDEFEDSMMESNNVEGNLQSNQASTSYEVVWTPHITENNLEECYFEDYLQSNEASMSSEIVETTCDEFTESILDSMTKIALENSKKRRYLKALDLYHKVWRMKQDLIGPQKFSTLIAESRIAQVHALNGQLDEALNIYEPIFNKLRASFANRKATRQILFCIASILKKQGKYKRASKYYASLEDSFKWQTNLVQELYNASKYNEALEIGDTINYKDMLHSDPDDQKLALKHMYHLGKILSGLGQHREAIKVFRELMLEMKNSLNVFTPLAANVIENFTYLLADVDDPAEDIRFLKNFSSNLSETLGEEHESALFVQFHLGFAHAIHGNFKEALNNYKELYKTQKEKNEYGIDAIQASLHVASMHIIRGKYDKAKKILVKAEEMFKFHVNNDGSFKEDIDSDMKRKLKLINQLTTMSENRKNEFRDVLILALRMPWFKEWPKKSS